MQKRYCDGSTEDRRPKGGPCEKADTVYYSWLNKNKLDDTKPMPESLNEEEGASHGADPPNPAKLYESFQWLGPVLPHIDKTNKIKIVALNAGKTKNLNRYIADVLKRAAQTMNGTPVWYGHSHHPEDKEEVGTNGIYYFEDNRVEGVAQVTPEIYDLVKKGDITKCSIEADPLWGKQINGFEPQYLDFKGVLLVPKGVEVGDPNTSVTILERINEVLASQTPPRSISEVEEKARMSQESKGKPPHLKVKTGLGDETPGPPIGEVTWTTVNDVNELLKKAFPGEQIPIDEYNLVVDVLVKARNKTPEFVVQQIMEAVWTTKYINQLTDDAFAYIEPGGKKDEEGKTVPRTIRHLPYKDAQGNIDLSHLRNALARLPQTNLSADAKKKALKVLCAAAKSKGLEFASCETLSEQYVPPKKGKPKTGEERLMDHFGEETALKLLDLIGGEAYNCLPERGAKLSPTSEIEDLWGKVEALDETVNKIREEVNVNGTSLGEISDKITAVNEAIEELKKMSHSHPKLAETKPMGKGIVSPGGEEPEKIDFSKMSLQEVMEA